MISRLLVSLSLALMGVFALTAPSYAAIDDLDKTEVMVGTGLVVLCLMAVLFVAYLIKHALGLDKMPPPIESADGHH